MALEPNKRENLISKYTSNQECRGAAVIPSGGIWRVQDPAWGPTNLEARARPGRAGWPAPQGKGRLPGREVCTV